MHSKDLKRDFYLTAAEAAAYGLIDKVLLPHQVAHAIQLHIYIHIHIYIHTCTLDGPPHSHVVNLLPIPYCTVLLGSLSR